MCKLRYTKPGAGSRFEVPRCECWVGRVCVWGGALSLHVSSLLPSVVVPFTRCPCPSSPFSSSIFFLLLVVSWCCVGDVVWEECEIFSAKLKLTNSSYLTSSSEVYKNIYKNIYIHVQ